MRNQIVILAAGKGTRMGGNIPKVLVMLKNKPLILYVLEQIEKINQLTKPLIVVGFGAGKVQQVLGNDYTYVFQEKQLGTANALLAAKNKVKAENVLVLYGDMPFIKAESLKELIKMHFKTGSPITMLTVQAPNFKGLYDSLEHYGRIVRDTNHQVAGVVEFRDASVRQKKIKEVNPGIYMFNTKWLWQNLPKVGNKNSQQEYYLTDIVSLAVSQGLKVKSLMGEPKEILGVNSKEDLVITEKLL